jgi:hypothetical protein
MVTIAETIDPYPHKFNLPISEVDLDCNSYERPSINSRGSESPFAPNHNCVGEMTKASAPILPDITPIDLVGGSVGSLGTFIHYPINMGIQPNVTRPLGSVVFAEYHDLIRRQYVPSFDTSSIWAFCLASHSVMTWMRMRADTTPTSMLPSTSGGGMHWYTMSKQSGTEWRRGALVHNEQTVRAPPRHPCCRRRATRVGDTEPWHACAASSVRARQMLLAMSQDAVSLKTRGFLTNSMTWRAIYTARHVVG